MLLYESTKLLRVLSGIASSVLFEFVDVSRHVTRVLIVHTKESQ